MEISVLSKYVRKPDIHSPAPQCTSLERGTMKSGKITFHGSTQSLTDAWPKDIKNNRVLSLSATYFFYLHWRNTFVFLLHVAENSWPTRIFLPYQQQKGDATDKNTASQHINTFKFVNSHWHSLEKYLLWTKVSSMKQSIFYEPYNIFGNYRSFWAGCCTTELKSNSTFLVLLFHHLLPVWDMN